jgi:sulfhydrogenase subunit alpha
MSQDININISHVTRVEGHGNIVVNSKNGKIEKIEWQISEAPRFFEAFIRGKDYSSLPHIVSRICGICSIGHTLASLKAVEAALNIQISEQTALLRRLALHAENMQSHILHVGYLAAPDLFKVKSVIPLIKTNKDTVLKIISLHRLANRMSDLVCGRTIHPIGLIVGGFTWTPTKSELINLKSQLINAIETVKDIAGIVKANVGALPSFERETEYVGLTSDKEYALYDGLIGSTDTGRHPITDYPSITNEFMVPYSTAKHTKHIRESYMVGALARLNLNYDKLSLTAKEVAKLFNLKPINYNPFMNNIAQLVEYVHSVEDSIRIIDTLLKELRNEKSPKISVKAGRGIGVVEVPRGILFHDYLLNDNGECIKANCVIPTNQNHRNIQNDMEAMVPTLLDKPQEEIELNLEMLVRAYDPCISCSTHYLNVKFI